MEDMSDHPPLPPCTVEDLSQCGGWGGIGGDGTEEVDISLGGICELTFKSLRNNGINGVDVNGNINVHEENNKDHN